MIKIRTQLKIKTNKVYLQAQQSKDRYRVLYGGAGSGKSHFVAQEILINMLTNSNYRYLGVRYTAKSIRNSMFKLLTDIISEYNLNSYFTINKTEMGITSITGSSIVTSGLDDVERLKSIANINRIWIEEANEISESDFTQLDLRLRGQSKIGYQMTLTFNPISELHWLKKMFFDVGRDNSFILKTTYLDNQFLDEQYITTLKELEQQDYNYYRVYALGDWGSIGNVIFSNWEKRDLTEEIKHFDNIFNGLDWGFSDDPTAFIQVHYNKKKKEIYIIDEFYKQGQFVDEIANDLIYRIKDNYITCDSSEPRSIADLVRNGIKALPAKKGPGSIEYGVKFLQSHKIIIHDKCTNAIKEVSSYRWKEDKNGNSLTQPVDKDNHLLDALRYALESEMLGGNIRTKNYSGKGKR